MYGAATDGQRPHFTQHGVAMITLRIDETQTAPSGELETRTTPARRFNGCLDPLAVLGEALKAAEGPSASGLLRL